MKVNTYILNAFTDDWGGNPAGVVLGSDNLTVENMKKIAKILGFSETAFIMKSEVADFRIRFFTPSDEVDLCGHATIAAFTLLLKKNLITPGIYTQETKAGVLKVTVKDDYTVMMNQNLPEFWEVSNISQILSSLNISEDSLSSLLPIEIVSTGLRDILIPLKDSNILKSIQPNFSKIKEISQNLGVVGYHIFSLDGGIQCRNFAPLYEIDEESATGTSNGALASYLFKHGALDATTLSNLTIKQGHFMGSPSQIKVSLIFEKDEIIEVLVGGRGVVKEEKILEID